ncbi:MAG: TonB-dependent receptor plug domain-containing protein, partial [Sphingopyxis sp.]
MKRTFLASSASILVMMAAPAMAQNAQSSDAARAAEANGDIVGTATRSETLLSKTPIALTAISGDGLRDAGVSDARALADVVPNLAITENGDGLRISIRGITSTDGTEKGDPSAAFLLDGIYIARPQDQQGAFFDVERVEVLRGPQGTLYGRNTTAGVVNVITARPGSEFGGSVDGQYASRNTVNVTGVVNVPLSESLGVRLAANYDRADNNLSEGVAGPYSINPAREIISTRLTFGGELGDLSFVIRGDYSQQKGSMQNSLPLNVFFPGTYTPTVNPLYVDNGSDVQTTLPYALAYPSVRDNEFYGVMGEFNYSLGSVDLTYVGSYRESKRSDVREFMLFGSLQNPATFTGDFQQQSHELR